MQDSVVLALVMATLGQAGLCISLLVTRSMTTPVYIPLAVFFAASGFVTARPTISAFAPAWESHFISLLLPAYLTLGPTLLLYVQGLTSEQKWRPHRKLLWHFVPAGLGVIATLLLLRLPNETRVAMLITGIEDELLVGPDGAIRYLGAIAIYLFALILFWLGQSGFYLICILLKLSRYRRRLKDLFASNEHRELTWVVWLTLIIGSIWLLSFTSVVMDNFYGIALLSEVFGKSMSLMLVWALAVWGLRQKPGFDGRYVDPTVTESSEETTADSSENAKAKKYQRSALNEDHARRIAQKLEAYMEKDQLYLDPDLSLHKLARHVSITPNYISQTLNETLEASFFDYVNAWRIKAAKPRIIIGEETVQDVALDVGFNARSSFYKAFKKETGMTPIEFRLSQIEK